MGKSKTCSHTESPWKTKTKVMRNRYKKAKTEEATPLRTRPKLLTGAQRKALEQRVRSHAHILHYEAQKEAEATWVPDHVKKAQKIIELWENKIEQATKKSQSKIDKEAKQIYQNLLFDSVESALLQVEEFENWTP